MKPQKTLQEQLPELRQGQSIELLKELHILTREGKLNQDTRRKLKQVYHLVQFIEPLLAESCAQRSELVSLPQSLDDWRRARQNRATVPLTPHSPLLLSPLVFRGHFRTFYELTLSAERSAGFLESRVHPAFFFT